MCITFIQCLIDHKLTPMNSVLYKYGSLSFELWSSTYSSYTLNLVSVMIPLENLLIRFQCFPGSQQILLFHLISMIYSHLCCLQMHYTGGHSSFLENDRALLGKIVMTENVIIIFKLVLDFFLFCLKSQTFSLKQSNFCCTGNCLTEVM